MNGTAHGTAIGTPWINAVLGAWLIVSAFVWHHGPMQFTNTWLMGAIVLAVALVANAVPWARFLNTVAAFYLFFSTLFLPRDNIGTLWHNCILAALVFIFAMMPMSGTRRWHPHLRT